MKRLQVKLLSLFVLSMFLFGISAMAVDKGVEGKVVFISASALLLESSGVNGAKVTQEKYVVSPEVKVVNANSLEEIKVSDKVIVEYILEAGEKVVKTITLKK